MATFLFDGRLSVMIPDATSDEAAAIVAAISLYREKQAEVAPARHRVGGWALAGRFESHGLIVTRERLVHTWRGQ